MAVRKTSGTGWVRIIGLEVSGTFDYIIGIKPVNDGIRRD